MTGPLPLWPNRLSRRTGCLSRTAQGMLEFWGDRTGYPHPNPEKYQKSESIPARVLGIRVDWGAGGSRGARAVALPSTAK